MNGVEGVGKDAEMLSYSFCDGIDPVVEVAFAMYRGAGMDFEHVPVYGGCDPVLPGGQPGQPNQTGWFADQDGPNGEFVFDTTHGIRVVTSATDPAYVNLVGAFGRKPPGQSFVATSYAVGGPGLTGPNVGWEVFLNHVDYPDYWQDALPSQGEFEGVVGRHWVDVTAHELMHVLGSTHDVGLDYLTAVNVGTGVTDNTVFAHLALEVDAELYHLDGSDADPAPGYYLLPAADQVFLDDKYGAQGWDWGDLRMHAWNVYYDSNEKGLAYYPINHDAPLGPTAGIPWEYDTLYVQDEDCLTSGLMFTTEEREQLAKAVPKFTATEARDVRVRFGTTPLCTGDCDQVTVGLDGYMDIDVPAEGDPSFPPIHSYLAAVSPNNTEFDGVSGHLGYVYGHAQVTASIYEVLPGDIEVGLWLDVPLNVLLGVSSCATPEQ